MDHSRKVPEKPTEFNKIKFGCEGKEKRRSKSIRIFNGIKKDFTLKSKVLDRYYSAICIDLWIHRHFILQKIINTQDMYRRKGALVL